MAIHSSKKCKKCKYRAGEQANHGCDYFCITGKLRGGTASECTKFEKGAKIKCEKTICLKGWYIVADIICKGSLILTLLAIVFVVYCCLIKGARQDEINQKVWDEYEKSESVNWEE